jgi:hypothetical protein
MSRPESHNYRIPHPLIVHICPIKNTAHIYNKPIMLQPLKNTTRLLGGREIDRLYHGENRNKGKIRMKEEEIRYYDIPYCRYLHVQC